MILRPGPAAALAVGAVLLAYVPSLGGPFFTDDHAYVVDNPSLRELPLSRPWRFLLERTNPFEYLPLRDLSYRIDLELFGDTPAGFKAHNLLLYSICCLLVWLVVRETAELLRPGSCDVAGWIATVATALFAAHPAHVESVAWISGRKDLVSGVWGLSALWCFTRAVRSEGRARWLVASVGCFAAALLAKSTVLPLPLAMAALLLAASRSRRARRRLLGALLVMAAIGVAAMTLHTAIGSETDVLRTNAGALGATSLATAARILGALTRIAIAPVRLRLIYDLGGRGSVLLPGYLLATAAVAAATWGLWRMRARPSLPAYGAVLFAVMCLPFLQIVPFRTWSLASERFLFLPLLGLAIAVAEPLVHARFRHVHVLAPTIFLVLLGGTYARSLDWRSTEALLTGTARLSPGNHLAVEWGLDALIERGDHDAALASASGVRDPAIRSVLENYVRARQALARGDVDRAAALVRRAANGVVWNSPVFRLKVANLALEVGEPEIAEAEYRTALEADPRARGVRYNLALALDRLGRKEEATEQLRGLIQAGERRGEVWNRLGLLERDLGRVDAAEESFRSALRDDPTHWHAAYNLGRLYAAEGHLPDALRALAEARTRAIAAGADTAPIDRIIAALESKRDAR